MDSSSKFQSLSIFIIFSFLFVTFVSNLPSLAEAVDQTTSSMRPFYADEGLKSTLIDEAKRRQLSSFQICALCTCCGGPKGLCLPSPCCYAINCNIPNRPFGFCSFTPRTCNCFGCHL